MADIYPESRVEEILVATIDGTEYTEYPQSRIEQLLIELKAVIEAGGGGGGTTNYNLLINKPEIDGVELSGNKSLSDLGITQEIKKVMDMLAGQFDPTETYEEGKIVIYNKTLYMFTTDHAAGEFNPLEVEQTDMDRILAAVYNVIPTDLSDLDDDSTHRTVTDTEKSEWNSKQSNVNLTLTPDAVVSDRDVTDGSGNTLSVVADSVSTPKTATGNPVIVEDALESNAESLVAQIVPIQDLHGYDKPWVGGAGKNKLHNTATGGTVRDVVYTVQTDGTVKANGLCNGGNAQLNIPITGLSGDYYFIASPANGGNNIYDAYVWDTTAGARVKRWDGTTESATDTNGTLRQIKIPEGHTCVMVLRVYNGYNAQNVVFTPMICASTETDPTFAPWENKCPISGRTEVNLGRTGKNLWSEAYTDIDTNLKSVILTVGSGNFTMSSDCPLSSNNAASLFITDPSVESVSTSTYGVYENRPRTITADANGQVKVWYRITDNVNPTNYHAQLEFGSEATPYEPYIAPVTLTIALGQTVYGGTLDVKTGVAEITKAFVTFDGSSDESWYVWNSNMQNSFQIMLEQAAKPYESTDMPDVVSNMYVKDTRSNVYNNGTGITVSNNRVYLNVPTATDITTAKAWASNHNIEVCYELATPTTIQLTGAELALLMGYNRITSDSGDITLTYKANAVQDLQADKADNADMVDFIENGNKASRAYTANQFMLWKGDLYKVTTSIASGATITAGTNVTKTTIGAVLTALLNA